ncbi:hypothetical protein CFC21_100701 [Triticum aestivum]|uniref:DUF3615 domain-containing protein n=2 Tax=Triticum aestivum TaxID=4565 RepID=A0A3B6RSV6_WHEAT|nr:uncharacterized protein LOC123149780 [Triticum aestivum]KAF7099011.1 hypothetical protein CFC21_100701 [Triticum aestivum]
MDPNPDSKSRMDDGPSWSLSSQASSATSSRPVDGGPAAPARKRKPGTWRRLPRTLPLEVELRMKLGFITHEELRRQHLARAEELERMDDSGCDSEEAKVAFRDFKKEHVRWYRKLAEGWPENIVINYDPKPSDTEEEYLTAEDMEARFAHRDPTSLHLEQLKHFANLALAHYNARKTEHKFDISQALTSNCFSEACGTTYAHVNFTAKPQKSDDPTKRLFFAELMLIPKLQLQEDAEPMRVLHVSIIDDAPCFGGCHEIYRNINHRMRGAMDYERCHACHDILKHPKGDMFIGGHDSTRMPYISAT